MRWLAYVCIIALASCHKQEAPLLTSNEQPLVVVESTPVPLIEQPSPTGTPPAAPEATPLVTIASPLLGLPTGPTLTDAGHNLIIEFEVGGKGNYKPRAEAPDWNLSGITVGIGYDLHYNKSAVIFGDWQPYLGTTDATRLSDAHPYYGGSAKKHLKDVYDILIPWQDAVGVFDVVDVARTFADCKRAFPGFEKLRANAQAALISLVFNRGASMVGPSRLEMRQIRDAVPTRDYETMADADIRMIRVWVGTENYRGLKRRREAEAKLLLTP